MLPSGLGEVGYGYLSSSILGTWPQASGVFHALLGESLRGERDEAPACQSGRAIYGKGTEAALEGNPWAVVTGQPGHTCFSRMGVTYIHLIIPEAGHGGLLHQDSLSKICGPFVILW